MPSQPAWFDARADALLRHLSDLGMSLSSSAAAEMSDERVEFVTAAVTR